MYKYIRINLVKHVQYFSKMKNTTMRLFTVALILCCCLNFVISKPNHEESEHNHLKEKSHQHHNERAHQKVRAHHENHEGRAHQVHQNEKAHQVRAHNGNHLDRNHHESNKHLVERKGHQQRSHLHYRDQQNQQCSWVCNGDQSVPQPPQGIGASPDPQIGDPAAQASFRPDSNPSDSQGPPSFDSGSGGQWESNPGYPSDWSQEGSTEQVNGNPNPGPPESGPAAFSGATDNYFPNQPEGASSAASAWPDSWTTNPPGKAV
ncbi:uncharacterized histidine-rich protein DDB_G0274557-like isoform X2 [Diorhabda sublineata]|uniref:uncharacterized histidine-rich protein DDB_G0274557-like isoform X2 n=1 Tax=Diorhabda sublineata TaxID=1163346 RepID=UPI0024E13721|nr:uncharacterized histidine-rich protein DDB_G0274557-like isoform X2 [Diorhabda sublineata]